MNGPHFDKYAHSSTYNQPRLLFYFVWLILILTHSREISSETENFPYKYIFRISRMKKKFPLLPMHFRSIFLSPTLLRSAADYRKEITEAKTLLMLPFLISELLVQKKKKRNGKK